MDSLGQMTIFDLIEDSDDFSSPLGYNPPSIPTKTCLNCNEAKPIWNFAEANNTRNADGRSYWCGECSKKLSDREKGTQAVRLHRSTEVGKAELRDNHLKKTFGLSQKDYEAMLEAQGGACAICGQPEITRHTHRGDRVLRLAVDHCHRTGKVRALLCRRCNHTLGNVSDDPDLLLKMAEYLENHRGL